MVLFLIFPRSGKVCETEKKWFVFNECAKNRMSATENYDCSKKEMNECAGWIINIHSFASAKVSVLKLGPWNRSMGKKLNLNI